MQSIGRSYPAPRGTGMPRILRPRGSLRAGTRSARACRTRSALRPSSSTTAVFASTMHACALHKYSWAKLQRLEGKPAVGARPRRKNTQPIPCGMGSNVIRSDTLPATRRCGGPAENRGAVGAREGTDARPHEAQPIRKGIPTELRCLVAGGRRRLLLDADWDCGWAHPDALPHIVCVLDQEGTITRVRPA